MPRVGATKRCDPGLTSNDRFPCFNRWDHVGTPPLAPRASQQALWNRRKSAAPSAVKRPVSPTLGLDIERELAAIHRSFMRTYV